MSRANTGKSVPQRRSDKLRVREGMEVTLLTCTQETLMQHTEITHTHTPRLGVKTPDQGSVFYLSIHHEGYNVDGVLSSPS
jgi:hypothetical protein